MQHTEFDRHADHYDAQHRASIAVSGEEPDYFAEYKISTLAKLITAHERPGRILDFGSGIGNSIPFFRRFFPSAALTCADVSARSLELSQLRFPGPERHTLIEDRIPEQRDSFDLTFSACVFHHIPRGERQYWLGELRRVTRPGGICALFEHNPYNPVTVWAVAQCPFDKDAELISARSLAKSLEDAGWCSLTVNYVLFFPRLLRSLRPLEPHLNWCPLGAQYSVLAR